MVVLLQKENEEEEEEEEVKTHTPTLSSLFGAYCRLSIVTTNT